MKRFLGFILWQPDKSSLVKVMDEPVKANIYFVTIENNCILIDKYYKSSMCFTASSKKC